MSAVMRIPFLRGFFRGLGSPSEIYGEQIELEREESALEALRSDWERIGQDFRTVIGHEVPCEEESKPADAAEKRHSAA
jgi:hypothetical protein